MKSWVWSYATKVGDSAFCDLCHDREKNEFSCRGGSTGAIGKHLKVIHLKSPLPAPNETLRSPPLQCRASPSVRRPSVPDVRSAFDSTAGEMSNEFSDDTVDIEIDTASVKVMDEDVEDPESDTPEPTPARARPRSTAKFCADTDVALIECVRARTVLYDPGHSRYMDVHLKNNIWNKIGKQLRVNPAACKSRWNNIRDNYRKTLRKRGPSGSNNYKFAKMLSFMDHYYKGKLLPADDCSSNDENEDEGEKKEVTHVTVKVAQSDTEDQESAIDEFERSSVSVSGNQVPGSSTSSNQQGEAVDAFLAAISPSLKGLSPYHLSMAKAEIFATVHKYELKGIVEGGWGSRDINPLP